MVNASIGLDHFKTEISASGHTVLADEGESIGGSDLGPNPREFILMALASCTAITLRMYANRKNFAVDNIKVEVSEEASESETLFWCTISIEGSLTGEQRQRMLEIAEICPVHKTLLRPIDIKTQLV